MNDVLNNQKELVFTALEKITKIVQRRERDRAFTLGANGAPFVQQSFSINRVLSLVHTQQERLTLILQHLTHLLFRLKHDPLMQTGNGWIAAHNAVMINCDAILSSASPLIEPEHNDKKARLLDELYTNWVVNETDPTIRADATTFIATMRVACLRMQLGWLVLETEMFALRMGKLRVQQPNTGPQVFRVEEPNEITVHYVPSDALPMPGDALVAAGMCPTNSGIVRGAADLLSATPRLTYVDHKNRIWVMSDSKVTTGDGQFPVKTLRWSGHNAPAPVVAPTPAARKTRKKKPEHPPMPIDFGAVTPKKRR